MHLFGSTSSACQCRARSKRSGEQCRKAAMRGKSVCRSHGGASTGPRTAAGRARCAEAKTVHGWETRAVRETRAEKLRELRELEHYIKGTGPAPVTPVRNAAGCSSFVWNSIPKPAWYLEQIGPGTPGWGRQSPGFIDGGGAPQRNLLRSHALQAKDQMNETKGAL